MGRRDKVGEMQNQLFLTTYSFFRNGLAGGTAGLSAGFPLLALYNLDCATTRLHLSIEPCVMQSGQQMGLC